MSKTEDPRILTRKTKKGWIGKIQVINSNGDGIQVQDNGFFTISGRPFFASDDLPIATILVSVYESKSAYRNGKASLNSSPFIYKITNDVLVSDGAGGDVGLFDKYFGFGVSGKDFDNAIELISTLTGDETWNRNRINFSIMTLEV